MTNYQPSETEIETVAKAIYLSFFLPDWPPKGEVDLGLDADAFRRAARNVLMAQRGEDTQLREVISREQRLNIHDLGHGTYFPGRCEECLELGWDDIA